MMGVEPIQRGLATGAYLVLAGRSSDSALYATMPITMGCQADSMFASQAAVPTMSDRKSVRLWHGSGQHPGAGAVFAVPIWTPGAQLERMS